MTKVWSCGPSQAKSSVRATLLVLAGYLAAEIFLGGYVAAGAVLLLASGEFLFLLGVRKEKHLSLLAEGAVLSAVLLAGERLASMGYGGGGFVLLELVLGGVLTGSALAGRPWLESRMKRLAGFSAGREFAGEASLALGLLFLVHGIFIGILMLASGGVPVLPAALAFLVLYAGAVMYIRKSQRMRVARNTPRVTVGDDGKAALEVGGRKLGSMELHSGPAAIVTGIELEDGVKAHEFLQAMEHHLRNLGCRAVRLPAWNGDDLALEISGYSKTSTGWNKLL